MNGIIETVSGRLFNVFEPDPHLIDIGDIAYALAGENRYGNHSWPRYSVAQHSVRVSDRLLPYGTRLAFAGLLHDAAEAYIGDIPRPIKQLIPEFGEVESRLQDVIYRSFGIDPGRHDLGMVKRADNSEMRNEARQFMSSGGDWWNWDKPMLQGENDDIIVPLDADAAETAFLDRFYRFWHMGHGRTP